MSASPRAPTIASLNKLSTVCDVEIEGIDTKAFVDTGAEISLISEKFRQSSNVLRKLKVESVNGLEATSVNNEPVHLLGRIKLNLKLGKVDTSWTFFCFKRNVTPSTARMGFYSGQ